MFTSAVLAATAGLAALLLPTGQAFCIAPAIKTRSFSTQLFSTSSAVSTDQAKSELSKALAKYGKDTKADEVAAAVQRLADLKPAPYDLQAEAGSLIDGRFSAEGFKFSGGEFAHGGWYCTLGRLAFNLFEPIKLPVVIMDIINEVVPLSAEDAANYDGELLCVTTFQ